MTKEARLHNVTKTVCSTNGAGRIGPLHAEDFLLSSFFILYQDWSQWKIVKTEK